MNTDDKTIRYKETKYGFNYGALDITRIHSDPQKGYILLSLKTPKKELQVYVTKTGKIRIYDHKDGRELL